MSDDLATRLAALERRVSELAGELRARDEATAAVAEKTQEYVKGALSRFRREDARWQGLVGKRIYFGGAAYTCLQHGSVLAYENGWLVVQNSAGTWHINPAKFDSYTIEENNE